MILRKYPDLARSSIWGNEDPKVLDLVSAAISRMMGPAVWTAFA